MAGGVDHKELAALAELQDKLEMHQGFNAMVKQQLSRVHLNGRRADLTLQELSGMPGSVPMYKQVGKAYFLAPAGELLEELKSDIAASADEVKKLTAQQEHAAKALRQTEAELRECIQSLRAGAK